MSESVFNPDTFLGTTTEAAGATTYFPVPVGEYAKAQVTKVDGREITSQKPATLGQKYRMIEVTWEVLDDAARKATEQEHPTVRQTIFVDLTAQGALDFGKNKNVPLSKLRDAVGQNRQGKKWSPSHLMGQLARIVVRHRVNEETGEPMAEVQRVAPV